MFSIFTPYGGTAPLNIGGRPGSWGSAEAAVMFVRLMRFK